MKVFKKNNVFTKSKGFTLVELIVVIAIIGILAAVLIPSITGYINRAKDSSAMQEAETIKMSYMTWQIERTDMADVENAKDDFLVYLIGLKLISGDQGVMKRINELNYENGFLFRANNGILVEAVYDLATESLTLAKVEG